MRQEVAVPVAELDAAPPGTFLRRMLPVPVWMPNGALVTSVLVGRVEGIVRAYANVCMHHPLPLDHDAPSAMAEDGCHLICHQHGALYRPSDGLCIDGPCRGERLFPAGVEASSGLFTVFLDG